MDRTPAAAIEGAEPVTGSSAGSVSASIRDRADPALVLGDRVEQLYSQMWLGILMTFAIGAIATFELWELRLRELVLFWWGIVLFITASSAGLVIAYRRAPDRATNPEQWLRDCRSSLEDSCESIC